MATISWEQIRSDYNSFLEELSQSSLDRRERATLQRKANAFGQALSLYDELSVVSQELSDL